MNKHTGIFVALALSIAITLLYWGVLGYGLWEMGLKEGLSIIAPWLSTGFALLGLIGALFSMKATIELEETAKSIWPDFKA